MKKIFARHFHQQPFAAKFLWLVMATFAFLVWFYSGTIMMSILYPLDEALLTF